MLTVEDGTNVTDANSYNSLDELTTHHTATGNSAWVDETDAAQKEAAAIRSTIRLDASYKWNGSRSNGRSQSLQWPRKNIADCEGVAVASSEIPTEIKQAHAELTLIELVSPSSTTASSGVSDEVTGLIKRKREKVGSLEEETEYSTGGESTPSLNAGYSPIERVNFLIRCFGEKMVDSNGPATKFLVRS